MSENLKKILEAAASNKDIAAQLTKNVDVDTIKNIAKQVGVSLSDEEIEKLKKQVENGLPDISSAGSIIDSIKGIFSKK